MTLTLTEADTDSTVVVAQDSNAIREQVTSFVDAYNTLKDTVGSLTAYNPESGSAGELNGDSATRTVENTLRQALSSSTGGDGFNVL
ncbi:flagellar filament capping protein FliD, partial [Proteus faecis]|uniref:flagellar filament capping protein FliD n=1 Tax=Proteus faecis TaxID=2050967 RepID=UPI003B018076